MSREIDALVAKHVFGLTVTDNLRPYVIDADDGSEPLPYYSEDLLDAWTVYEKIFRLEDSSPYGPVLVLGRNPHVSSKSDTVSYCMMYMDYDCLAIYAEAKTPAMAICLTALKLKGVSHEQT